jgi:hypothetical protein
MIRKMRGMTLAAGETNDRVQAGRALNVQLARVKRGNHGYYESTKLAAQQLYRPRSVRFPS